MQLLCPSAATRLIVLTLLAAALVPTLAFGAFTEFYCDPVNGNNVNGGSDSGSPSMSDTAGTGSWTSTTNVYVSVATTGTVAVGQFMSIYTGAETKADYTARITTVTGGSGSAWTITVSSTAVSGTKPTTGATYKAQVGGAWLGPNAAVNFPLDILAAAMTNSAGNKPRLNLKNNGTYSITASILPSSAINSMVRIEGYTSSAGDGGRAIIDGGTTGASYNLLNFPNVGTGNEIFNIIFQNNGSTGSAALVNTTTGGGAARMRFNRCVFHDSAGNGLTLAQGSAYVVEQCEFYLCNKNNNATTSALDISVAGCWVTRCFFHDNAGSNTSGLRTAAGSISNCVFDTNGAHGIQLVSAAACNIRHCDFYNNGGDGIVTASGGSSGALTVENSNFVKNTGIGIDDISTGGISVQIRNCGFGVGTQANSGGDIFTPAAASGTLESSGTVNYASGVTPWVDPANGDFRINLAAAKGAGRGAFTETQASYAGTIAYPDIGAAQHQDSGGSVIVIDDDD